MSVYFAPLNQLPSIFLNLSMYYITDCCHFHAFDYNEIEHFFIKFTGCSCLFSDKAIAPHSSTLAWKIPWMEEAGRLQSMGSQRVGHAWATSLSLFTFMHWRRKWQPTPVFLPGESQGRRSLAGCCLYGRTELGTTEATQQQQQQQQHQNRKLGPL